MIVVRLPWRAVPQYGVVVFEGRPRAVLDPRDNPGIAVLRNLSGPARTICPRVNPDALVDVLILEHDDALIALSKRFDVSTVEEK